MTQQAEGTFDSAVCIRRLMISTATAAFLCALSQPAWAQAEAQQLPATPSAEAPPPSEQQIVVTGSRIARRDYESNSPIVTVNETLLNQSGTTAIESNLNKLPQFAPAQTQYLGGDIQPTATSTPGAATVALRNIGANRSLVLLDGRRATPANALMVVDLNTIPQAAIDRVEVITGGASATYGADAVGGVVNFILKKNFQGLILDGQIGTTEAGDGREYRVSAFTGANFDDGKGNVMFGVEHQARKAALRINRDFFRRDWRDPNIAGTEFFPDFPFYTINGGGCGAEAHPNTFDCYPSPDALAQVFPQATTPLLPFFGQLEVVPGTGTVFGGMGIFGGTSVGGTYKFPFDLTGLKWKKQADGLINQNWLNELASLPDDRWNAFGRAEYNFSDNLSLFTQGYFTRSHVETAQQPSPAGNQWAALIPHGTDTFAGSLLGNGNTNPDYLPGGKFGLNCGPVGGCTNSQVFPVPSELGTLLSSRGVPGPNGWIPIGANGPFQLNQYLNFLGDRISKTDTFTYQLIAGLEGKIPGLDWTYEVYGSHGQTRGNGNLSNVASLERYRAIMDAPNYGVNFHAQGNALFNGFGANSATCTSGLNPFDEVPTSADCMEAIKADIRTRTDMEQSVWEGTLQGGLAELPGGQLRFAVGADYRRNRFDFENDNLTSQGRSFLDQAIGLFPSGNTHGTISLTEGYGELLIPVLADVPFARKLEINLGARYSDYNTTGGSWTWKATGNWDVNKWLTFRGGYNKAERSPNVGELYQAPQQTFAFPLGSRGDACSINAPAPYSANPSANSNAAQVRALCEAMMGAQGAIAFYGNSANQGGGFYFGFITTEGNAHLKAETAKTWTAGLVIQSPSENPWIRRLRLSADWYNIDVAHAIATSGGDIVQQLCFDPKFNPTFDPNNANCKAILRDPAEGTLADLQATYRNDGQFRTAGLDVQLDWNLELRDAGIGIPGSFGANILFNYLDKLESQVFPGEPFFDYAGTLGPPNLENGLNAGAYRWQTFSTFTYAAGPATLSLQWQHLPKTKSIEAATNPNTTRLGAAAYDLFNLHGTFSVTPSVVLRIGVDNLLDKDPPLTERETNPLPGTLAGGARSSRYDFLGRRYYVGISTKF